jgi:hypothetical protein
MPNQNFPTASVSISFSSDAIGEDGFGFALKGEVREEDNGGDTKFIFGGAAPVFRIYKSSNIKTVHKFSTDGNVSAQVGALATENISETVIFANSRTAGTKYPIKDGTLSVIPLGKSNLGAISQSGPEEIVCSKQSAGELDPIIGVYRISYKTDFVRHQLTGVNEPAGFGVGDFTDYPVHIHLIGVPA